MSATQELAVDISAFPDVVTSVGITDFLTSFAPHVVRHDQWQSAAVVLPAPLRRAVGLLMLHEQVPVDELPPALAAALPGLVAAGVCTLFQGRASMGELALHFTQGAFLFSHRRHLQPTLYFGDDSLALATRVVLPRRGRTLDLCAGTGMQSLVCALRGSDVVAVERNPLAAALCSVNAALNNVADQVDVRCGDLYEPVGGERFDTVVANPPLPNPANLPYPVGGDGGPDGQVLGRRILAGLPEHLAERGRAFIVGTARTDGFIPLGAADLSRFAAKAGLDLHLTIYSHAALVGDSARTVAAPGGDRQPDAARAEFASGYRTLGGTHLCTYLLRAEWGKGVLSYMDVSHPELDGLSWFR